MKLLATIGLIALCVSGTAISTHAQGFLPPVSKSTSTVSDADFHSPLLIGGEVPGSLTVIDENGKKRSLLSYKSYLEVLVVSFFSAECEEKKSAWPRFRRLDERYKDWRVAFLAVNVSTPEMLPELATTLKRQRLSWPTVQDDQHAAATLLNITGTPEALVIDESGVLKYRGPIDFVPAALNAVISHVDPVTSPEPPLKGACAL
jgi:thiol-disulfide isomerase/thioredoxin